MRRQPLLIAAGLGTAALVAAWAAFRDVPRLGRTVVFAAGPAERVPLGGGADLPAASHWPSGVLVRYRGVAEAASDGRFQVIVQSVEVSAADKAQAVPDAVRADAGAVVGERFLVPRTDLR